tara:strand:+ start:22776 stop:23147 length:372 start_codon:yes stop_codon:yes gene_type:complete
MTIDIIAIALVVFGTILFLGSSVGLIRFPDFYTRMHAAGKGDTLSTLLIVGGLGVYHLHDVIEVFQQHGEWHKPLFVIFKMLGICLFIMFTSPTSTHALIEAGYSDGIKPTVERDDLKTDLEK